jgi:hypothetical protein
VGLVSFSAPHDHFENGQGPDCQGSVVAVAGVRVVHGGLDAPDDIASQTNQRCVLE